MEKYDYLSDYHKALTIHFPTMYITTKDTAETIKTKARINNSVTFFFILQ